MESLFDVDAPKKATNLSVNSDLLKKARALDINLSATLEQALKAKLAKLGAAEWVSENGRAIKSYNEFVEEHGCFGEEYKEY
jgi:antitoxin CcdA